MSEFLCLEIARKKYSDFLWFTAIDSSEYLYQKMMRKKINFPQQKICNMQFLCIVDICPKNDTFNPVIAILVNWHISDGNFTKNIVSFSDQNSARKCVTFQGIQWLVESRRFLGRYFFLVKSWVKFCWLFIHAWFVHNTPALLGLGFINELLFPSLLLASD